MELLLSRLLEPVGILWSITLIGLIVAARKRQGASAMIFGSLALLMSLGGSRLSTHLLATLEKPYVNRRLDAAPEADAVVMLGGVLKRSTNDVFESDLGEAADRALAAMELVRRGKAKVLVFGGGGGRSRDGAAWQEGMLLEGWAKAWGVKPTNVITLKKCANTHEEALLVRNLARENGWQRILLVTSAYHMKRAEGLFRKLQIPIVPVASDFTGLSELALVRPYSFVPESGRFDDLRLYLHEQIGWVYYWLRSRVE